MNMDNEQVSFDTGAGVTGAYHFEDDPAPIRRHDFEALNRAAVALPPEMARPERAHSAPGRVLVVEFEGTGALEAAMQWRDDLARYTALYCPSAAWRFDISIKENATGARAVARKVWRAGLGRRHNLEGQHA
ncbi:MAG: hypothetical protein Kow00120_06350 [Anaerolineae bacterium]